MRARTRPHRIPPAPIQRPAQVAGPRRARAGRPDPQAGKRPGGHRALTTPKRPDPRAFLRRLRSVAGVAAVGTFGAFLALTSLNVVGVTAHGGSPTPSGAAANLETLPPGDFFGPTGNAGSGSGQRAGFPVLAPGGDLPMLISGGS